MSNRKPSENQIRSVEPAEAGHRCLLIVDDDPRICRILSRRLESSFDTLFSASTLKEATRRLDSEKITHLICDHDLGDDVPSGTVLVERWRREHRSIERAVLFTGAYLDNAVKFPGLDAVVFKSTDFFDLMQALGLRNAEAPEAGGEGRDTP